MQAHACMHCLDRGAVGQNYFVSWHPSGEHLVYGLFERYIGILLPKSRNKNWVLA